MSSSSRVAVLDESLPMREPTVEVASAVMPTDGATLVGLASAVVIATTSATMASSMPVIAATSSTSTSLKVNDNMDSGYKW